MDLVCVCTEETPNEGLWATKELGTKAAVIADEARTRRAVDENFMVIALWTTETETMMTKKWWEQKERKKSPKKDVMVVPSRANHFPDVWRTVPLSLLLTSPTRGTNQNTSQGLKHGWHARPIMRRTARPRLNPLFEIFSSPFCTNANFESHNQNPTSSVEERRSERRILVYCCMKICIQTGPECDTASLS